MNEKLIETLGFYKNSCERKQNMINRIHTKMKREELEINEKISLSILESEVRMLKEFIDDLEYIKGLEQ